jgi:16S rRNA (adenine1518-N6/adenine1519-N6)-dimethyltransferase
VTLTRGEVSRLLREHGLAPRRSLGQNFVVDANTVRRIARLAGVGPGDHVLEIGAGLGCLTLALAETGASVVAVEVDRGLVPLLTAVVGDRANVEVIHADARELDWDDLARRAPRWHLVANLPYNVATPLVADILDDRPIVEHLLVMVQREVAERLCAGVGDDAYGAVSVKVAYWGRARIVGDVPPTVFLPEPRVTSALVDIRRHASPAVDVDPDALFSLVRAGFATRRKTLRRALGARVAPEAYERAGVRPEARAEELDVEAWARLLAASSVSSGP